MSGHGVYEFGNFRVDPHERLLWHQNARVDLKGKSFDVLLALLRSDGRAVAKQELLNGVWPDVEVEEANLTVAVSHLRKVLRVEDAGNEYIETLPGRGYRFLTQGQAARPRSTRPGCAALKAESLARLSPEPSPTVFIGREAESHRLGKAREEISRGGRRVIFLIGEPGIGKTALFDSFCNPLEARESFFVLRSACLDSYGSSEPYLPVLTALVRLCRGAAGKQVVDIIKRVAPTWAAQLPELFTLAELEGFARRATGVSAPRILGEFATLVGLLSEQRPLAWCMEDLHSADHSTLELLMYLARRTDLSRLLILGTYRPTGSAPGTSLLRDLTTELELRNVGQKVALEPLSERQIQQYLDVRFAGHALPAGLAALMHQRTCGTPLFLVQWVDALVDKGFAHCSSGRWSLSIGVAEVGTHLPDTTAQTIEMQIDRLGQRERGVLEAACVSGLHFSVAALADVLGEDCVAIEELCLSWARQSRLLQILGEAEWPDGTRTTRCGFAHALYQEVLYRRLGVAARARLHERFGLRMESAYGFRASEIASELALHFERSGDRVRAAQYLYSAGKIALERCAYASAIAQFKRGLGHLNATQEGPQRLALERDLQSALGAAQGSNLGHAAPEVRATYERVTQLSESVGDISLTGFFGAWMTLFMRGEYAAADELALRLSRRGDQQKDQVWNATASLMTGLSAFYLGRLADARRQLEYGLETLDFDRRPPGAISALLDPVFFGYNLAWAHWVAGFPDKALALIERGLASPQVPQYSLGHAYLLHFASVVHEMRGEYVAARARAEAKLPWCEHQELAFFVPLVQWQRALQARYLGEPGAQLAELQASISAVMGLGTAVAVTRPHAILAEEFMREGRLAEAQEALRIGFEFMAMKQERWWEAELHRIRGELWLLVLGSEANAHGSIQRSPDLPTPEACLQRALEIAQAQGAKSFELRAALSLARLWRSQGRTDQGRKLVTDVYGSFTEGFATRELEAARALLESWAGERSQEPSLSG